MNISLTSGYHPQSNGQAERLNQELVRFLRSYCSTNQLDWSRYLLWAEYAQNSLRKPATSLRSMHPGLPTSTIPLVRRTFQRPSVNDGYNAARRHGTKHIFTFDMQSGVIKYRPTDTEDTTRIPRRTVGMAVCPRPPTTSAMSQTQSQVRGSIPNYPSNNPCIFELNLPNHYRISPTFHVSLLKPPMIPGRDPRSRSRMQTPCPSQGRRGDIRCENFSIPDAGDALSNTWSIGRVTARRKGPGSTEDILDPSLVEEFHRDHPERPAPRPRGRPGVDHLLASGAAQGGGSVTQSAPTAPSPGHRREPSPEY